MKFQQQVRDLNAAWDRIILSGVEPDSAAAQQIAACHVEFLGAALLAHVLWTALIAGLTRMYVGDERFAEHDHRVLPEGPRFVRDAVQYWAPHNLSE